MSYTQRCAEAPLINIKNAADAHPDWEAEVSESSGELWLSHNDHEGSFCFGWIDINEEPDHVTTSVACYGGPMHHDLLRDLIRSAK